MSFEQLKEFRQKVYKQGLGSGKDAMFELMDAALCTPTVQSLVSLSLSPVFRRKWSSVYSGLRRGQLKRQRLKRQLVELVDVARQPLLAGDTSLWARPYAKTLKDRGYGYSGSKGIEIGHTYSTLAWVPEAEGSWSLPLCHERLTSFETPVSKASFQLQTLTRQLKVRPLAVYDRAYGNSAFLKSTARIEADLLLRLASNRCVWGPPPPYSGRGAPRKHGLKFKLNQPSTFPPPQTTLEVDEAKVGRVELSCWHQFHFRRCAQRAMDIIRVEVLQPRGRRRQFKPLWLAWVGLAPPDLDALWRQYLRRFSLEHWYRLAKQRLHWTLPQSTHLRALDNWSWLTVLMSWQLWIARQDCPDYPLPWQAPQTHLSAGRVAAGFAAILVLIGTPAKAPKTRGKSSGWQSSHSRPLKSPFPIIKKRFRPPKRVA